MNETERIQRISQPRSREVHDEMPDNDAGALGEERILRRSDGGFDMLRKLGDRWVRMSPELMSAEVSVDGVVLTIGSKRFKLVMEEI